MSRAVLRSCACAALLAAPLASAAGFQVDTHAARATGMATAVTAWDDDASAAFYNPALLAQGKHWEVDVGDTLIIPNITFAPSNPGSTVNTNTGALPPPHLYAMLGINEQTSLGLALFSPYGSAVSWPWPSASTDASTAGRFIVTSSQLATYYINPNVAMRFLDNRLKVGAGVDVVRGTITLNRDINFVDSTGQAQLGGGAWGVGGNAGVQFDALPDFLAFGASFRSRVALPFFGAAHFSNIPPPFQGVLLDSTVRGTVAMPASLQLGLMVHPVEPLRVGFDVDYIGWSAVKNITFNFYDPSYDPTLSSTTPKNWGDTWNVHLGGEYSVTDEIKVRAGVVYDPVPSPAATLGPDLPDASRVNIAVGAGYHTHGLGADLGYQFVVLTTTHSTLGVLPGSYSGNASVLGLTLSYRQ